MNRIVMLGSAAATCGLLVVAISMVDSSGSGERESRDTGATSQPDRAGARPEARQARSRATARWAETDHRRARAQRSQPQWRPEADAPVEAEPEAEPAEPTPAPSPEQIASAQQRWQSDYLAQLDQQLAEQDVDVAWSQEASAQLQQDFHQLAPQSSVRVSSCGSTLCKIELGHADDLGHEQLLLAAQTHFPWPGPAFLATGASPGAHESVVYVARPGTELPRAATELTEYW